MAIIKKKVWPDYFKLIKSSKKKFELRLADFKIKEGDTLIFKLHGDSPRRKGSEKSDRIRPESSFSKNGTI